jgi:hypothetical protein
MKFYSFLIALILPFFMLSCGDEATDVTHNSMKAKIAAKSGDFDYSSTSMSHSVLDAKYNIIAQTLNGRMTLIFPQDAHGDQGMGDQEPGSAIYTDLTTNVSYYSYSGNINISSKSDSRIEGTFHYKAVSLSGDSIDVKNGSFIYEF